MYVKILRDGQGNVFTPKVSADSVYLSGVATTLTTKLAEIQEALGEKLTTQQEELQAKFSKRLKQDIPGQMRSLIQVRAAVASLSQAQRSPTPIPLLQVQYLRVETPGH